VELESRQTSGGDDEEVSGIENGGNVNELIVVVTCVENGGNVNEPIVVVRGADEVVVVRLIADVLE
jgi:hypothetical protein